MKKSELLVPLGVNILCACNLNVLMGDIQAFISLCPTSLNTLNIMTRVFGLFFVKYFLIFLLFVILFHFFFNRAIFLCVDMPLDVSYVGTNIFQCGITALKTAPS